MEVEAETPDIGKTSVDVTLPNKSTGYAEGSAGEVNNSTHKHSECDHSKRGHTTGRESCASNC